MRWRKRGRRWGGEGRLGVGGDTGGWEIREEEEEEEEEEEKEEEEEEEEEKEVVGLGGEMLAWVGKGSGVAGKGSGFWVG